MQHHLTSKCSPAREEPPFSEVEESALWDLFEANINVMLVVWSYGSGRIFCCEESSIDGILGDIKVHSFWDISNQGSCYIGFMRTFWFACVWLIFSYLKAMKFNLDLRESCGENTTIYHCDDADNPWNRNPQNPASVVMGWSFVDDETSDGDGGCLMMAILICIAVFKEMTISIAMSFFPDIYRCSILIY